MMNNNYKGYFSTFPKEEYVERYKKAQKIMTSKNIDVLILTQKENIEYFAGYYTSHWTVKGLQNGVVLLYPDGDPTLVVPDFLSGTADKTTWVEDIVIHNGTHAIPRDFMNLVVDQLKAKGLLKGKRVAIEKGPEMKMGLAKEDHDILMDALADAEVVSGEDVIWGTRSIKSKREIECIKKAVSLTANAYRNLRDNYMRIGFSEVDMVRFVQTSVINNGADFMGFLNIRAGKPRYTMGDSFPHEKAVAHDGDMLILDSGAMYKGYFSDVCRVVYMGEPTKRHHEIYKMAVDAQKAGINAVKPGVKVSEVYNAVRRVLAEYNIKDTLSMCGHAYGLDLHEPPIITADCDDILQEGMVITIEPWIHDYHDLGVFAVEDTLVVTTDGHENITNLEKDELWVINR